MFGGALVRRAVIVIAAALLCGVAVRAQNAVDVLVEKFARESEASEAKKEAARKAEEARARKETDRKAAQASKSREIRKQAETARAAAIARREAEELQAAEEEEMLARARREAEEAKATNEIRSLIDRAEAERLRVEALIAEATGQAGVKPPVPSEAASNPVVQDLGQSEIDQGNVAVLTTRAASHRDVIAKLARVRNVREARIAGQMLRVAQEAEAERTRLEQEASMGRLRLVERRRLIAGLTRVRGLREARLAGQAVRVAQEVQADRARLEAEARVGLLRLTERRRLVARLARVRNLREARLAQALRVAQENARRTEEARLGLRRMTERRRLVHGIARVRQLREARLAARTPETAVGNPLATAVKGAGPQVASASAPTIAGTPAAPATLPPVVSAAPPSPFAGRSDLGGDPRGRVTVLLVMTPGTYGIRRGAVIADPILCVLDGCYVSGGAGVAAKFMPGHKALGIGNTLGGRAGACRQSLGCVFRGVELQLPGLVQPVDLHILKHDRRRPEMVSVDSDCRFSAGRLMCSRAHQSQSYTLWIVPEELANTAGPDALERAVRDGLAPARSAEAAPSR
jgi:hypothetical protein